MPNKPDTPRYDPVFLNARRETLLMLCIWGVFCLWVVGYCCWAGYDVTADNLKTVIGIPSWVFWGIVVPWLVANIVTVWFAVFYIEDDALGEDMETPSKAN